MNEPTGFPYPQWQIPAQDVLLETNHDQLVLKARRAEDLMQKRLRELQEANDARDEREALSYSLYLLQSITRDRLTS